MRQTKPEMSDDVYPDVPMQRYQGPQTPQMPPNKTTQSPLPLKVLTKQYISVQRANNIDYAFMTANSLEPSTPEFSGFNTKRSREQGHTNRPKTKAVYLPLIDMPPAEPDTMQTAMVESQRLTNMAGQTCSTVQYSLMTSNYIVL